MQNEQAHSGKFQLIKLWHQKELDFRLLFTFRNMLYASPKLDSLNRIPLDEFVQIRAQHDHA